MYILVYWFEFLKKRIDIINIWEIKVKMKE